MTLYKNAKLSISTIEEEDKSKVLEYFAENDFNCDTESGALRPSNTQFVSIMNGIISGKDDESNIFVMRKENEVIGYISMFVEYDRLKIGHIAIKKSERSQGYGRLLTETAIAVAENEGRDVSLYCRHPNSCFKKMGFESSDGIHYFHKSRGLKNENLPKLFVSVEEYTERKLKEQEKELESFKNFLNSSSFDSLFGQIDIDRNL